MKSHITELVEVIDDCNDRAETPRAKAPKSTRDLRTFLLEQMVNVAEGRQEAGQAKAICNYAQQVYNTVNLEMKFATARAKIGDAIISPVEF